MSGNPVLYEVKGTAAWITLNLPEKHNALTQALSAGLLEGIRRANADDAARMIVLTAEGRSFCAGADLKSSGGGAVGGTGDSSGQRPPFLDAIQALWDSPKPVIGRIQGNAYGGGLGLIAACDFAISVEGMHLAFTEVRLGLAPSIISVFVMRKISLPAATRYFLTGERFSAQTAVELGMMHRAVPAGELDAAVADLCGQLAHCGPQALQEVKKLLRTVPTLDVDAGLDWAAAKNLELFHGPEGREGMAAFAEKRPAAWVPKDH